MLSTGGGVRHRGGSASGRRGSGQGDGWSGPTSTCDYVIGVGAVSTVIAARESEP